VAGLSWAALREESFSGSRFTMRACVQRVSEAKVTVDGSIVGEIRAGMLVLLGVAQNDTEADASYLAEKLVGLRIFEDEQGKMNRSLADLNGQMLVVSQFTLLGDSRHGRRPSFTGAAPPELAVPLYERFVALVRGAGIEVQTGQFQAQMQVALVNEGPVTLLVDSRKQF
jgi:D-tyrosyl-tRNA(Tyr) deacylase